MLFWFSNVITVASVSAGIGAADREFYRIDTAGASDVSLLDLDAKCGRGLANVSKSALFLDLDANIVDIDATVTTRALASHARNGKARRSAHG
ncbi:MAG: hypothetical protein IPJ27_05750 [Candidatus Accumulibacter sp.]|uniref:Uncharacterized protein n=1 Tax=Candidatus Accumulibacter proximus TaxID=2954385 RepID=A0A935PXW1_9PROT|nr:hypothetical protein [Candidatus Accumulibacter proximus]